MPESGSQVHLLEANTTGERRDGYHDNLFKNETGSLSSSLLSVTGGSRRNLQPTGPAQKVPAVPQHSMDKVEETPGRRTGGEVEVPEQVENLPLELEPLIITKTSHHN